MPTSLIIVALVVAWLLVLVPIVARRRQEVAKTADSTLAARVVRSGGASPVEEDHPKVDDADADAERDSVGAAVRSHQVTGDVDEDDLVDDGAEDDIDEDDRADDEDETFDERPARPYRPGRGGFDPEAAAISARAKYAFRQRIVLCMLLTAAATGLLAGIVFHELWWAHAGVDLTLVGYLTYLRRQVRIEEEIRQRRTMRMAAAGRVYVPADEEPEEAAEDDVEPAPRRPAPARFHRPGAVAVDLDDEDPMFTELDRPDVLPYRRAVGQ